MAQQESLALTLKKVLLDFQKKCPKHECRPKEDVILRLTPTPLGENTYQFGEENNIATVCHECVLCGKEGEISVISRCPGCSGKMTRTSGGSSTEEYFGNRDTGHRYHMCKVYACTACPTKGVVLFIDQ